MAIRDLSQGAPDTAAQLPYFDSTNGVDRRASLATFANVLQGLLTPTGDFVTQFFAPNATGWSVTVVPPAEGADVWLVVTPLAGYAAGTVTLPANPTNGQEVLVTCTQAVTTLTVGGNGKTVIGAPATLAANAFFRLRFEGVVGAWYRVG